MQSRLIPFLIFISILLIIDIYSFQAVRLLASTISDYWKRFSYLLFWILSAGTMLIIMLTFFTEWREWPSGLRTYLFATIFILFFSKLVISIFLLTDDSLRGVRWVSRAVNPSKTTEGISRLKFISQAGLVVSGFFLFNFAYGMVKTGFNYRVSRIKLKLPNLPHAFVGKKIIQISDLHTGSFVSTDPIERAIKMVNDEKADMVFFTGDLVNDKYDEALPFKKCLSSIHAPLGVYSVLGNHDYGDYYQWKTDEAKKENLEKLKALHTEFGWKLLLNENIRIGEPGNDIALIGIENWGALHGFTKYGDLEKAYAGSEDAKVKFLLSHDPSHWDAQVTNQYKDIAATFAGHTHGFQFGFEITGLRWSPSQWMYKQWAGLYENGNQKLYVNRGLGFLFYPGRVGITPEITVFELERA